MNSNNNNNNKNNKNNINNNNKKVNSNLKRIRDNYEIKDNNTSTADNNINNNNSSKSNNIKNNKNNNNINNIKSKSNSISSHNNSLISSNKIKNNSSTSSSLLDGYSRSKKQNSTSNEFEQKQQQSSIDSVNISSGPIQDIHKVIDLLNDVNVRVQQSNLNLNKQVDSLSNQNSQLESENEQLKIEIKHLKEQLQKKSNENEGIKSDNELLNNQIENQENQISKLESEIEKLSSFIEELQDQHQQEIDNINESYKCDIKKMESKIKIQEKKIVQLNNTIESLNKKEELSRVIQVRSLAEVMNECNNYKNMVIDQSKEIITLYEKILYLKQIAGDKDATMKKLELSRVLLTKLVEEKYQDKEPEVRNIIINLIYGDKYDVYGDQFKKTMTDEMKDQVKMIYKRHSLNIHPDKTKLPGQLFALFHGYYKELTGN